MLCRYYNSALRSKARPYCGLRAIIAAFTIALRSLLEANSAAAAAPAAARRQTNARHIRPSKNVKNASCIANFPLHNVKSSRRDTSATCALGHPRITENYVFKWDDATRATSQHHKSVQYRGSFYAASLSAKPQAASRSRELISRQRGWAVFGVLWLARLQASAALALQLFLFSFVGETFSALA